MVAEVRRWTKIFLWILLLSFLAAISPGCSWIFLIAVPVFWYFGKEVIRQNRVDDEFQRIVAAHLEAEALADRDPEP